MLRMMLLTLHTHQVEFIEMHINSEGGRRGKLPAGKGEETAPDEGRGELRFISVSLKRTQQVWRSITAAQQ